MTDECVDVPLVQTYSLEVGQSSYFQTHIADKPVAFAQTESPSVEDCATQTELKKNKHLESKPHKNVEYNKCMHTIFTKCERTTQTMIILPETTSIFSWQPKIIVKQINQH